MNKLYYLGKPSDGFGWGVCNTNLVAALKKHCDVVVCDDDRRNRFDAPVFAPIPDHSLKPGRPLKAPRVMGYAFVEEPLTDAAKVNAEKYDVIFAGSEWCSRRIREQAGANNVVTLIQGIDFERFKPMPYRERQGFRVFSGGKYEFRKAQDVVIAAMRLFLDQRKDAILISAWHNPWPETMKTMAQSPLIDHTVGLGELPKERVFNIPPIPNSRTPEVYAESDVGLFPNRCEAGTNLVMMEYAACGRPVIPAMATGQAELFPADYPLRITQGSYCPAGWFHADVSDCLVQLERAYQNREALRNLGGYCANLMKPHTWDRAAKIIADHAFAS